MCGPRAIVQVVEIAAETLIKDGRTTDGQGAVGTGREASGVDCTSLGRRTIKLKLIVCNDGTDAALAIGQDAIGERQCQSAIGVATGTLWIVSTSGTGSFEIRLQNT